MSITEHAKLFARAASSFPTEAAAMHKRYRIISAPEGADEETLESFDDQDDAEYRLAQLIDDGDDCDLYLIDAENDL